MILRHGLWALPTELLRFALAVQPSAASPIPAPLRELPWAQLNFLHTTDTHGWHAGHLLEPSYSADWGDYISFSTRLREKADRERVDLLLIDTGDRIEGNGLYDASRPKGQYDLAIFDEQNVNLLCSGNHELYKRASVDYEYNTTVPRFRDEYLASNLDVIDPEDKQQKPLAQRYKKMTTKNQSIRILAMGFIFDFTDGANNIVVQKVEDAIMEKWFQDAIRDREVDLFLIIVHAAVDSPEINAIYKAIREQQWDTPIQIFGGHSHIRDYVKFDEQAYALESGRYLETIGFMSIDGLRRGGDAFEARLLQTREDISTSGKVVYRTPTYSRRYIDNNLYSFYHHTGLNSSTFPTPHGLNVSARIESARKSLNLDHTYGCSPQDYWTNRAPFPSESSIFSLLQDRVFPDMLSQEDRADVPRIVLSNTGAIRFDVFKGRFTIGTMYAVSPFTSGFRFVKDVPWKIAKLLLRILNQEVPQLWPTELATDMRSMLPVGESMQASRSNDLDDGVKHPLHETQARKQQPLVQSANKDSDEDLTPGYTTHDTAGSDGDDTLHSPIKFYNVPNCFESRISFPPSEKVKVGNNDADWIEANEPEMVDVVYNEFLEKYVLLALRFLGTDIDEGSTGIYMEGKTMTMIIGQWVSQNWKCGKDGAPRVDV